MAAFGGCKINLAGTYTLMAIDVADGLQATSAPLTICVGAPAQLGFVQQPGGYSGATPSTWSSANQPQVAIEDAGGNVVTGASSTIALTLNQNGNAGTLSGSTCTSAVPTTSGEVAFTNCDVSAVGAGYTLTATGTRGFSGTTTSQAFSIAGTPTHPGYLSQPAALSNGNLASIGVGVYDASNRLVTASTGGTVTLSIATGPSGGILRCNGSTAPSATVSHGVATFTGCGVSASGTTAYTLTATTSSPALSTASVTSSPGFTVSSISAPTFSFPTSTDPQVVKHNTNAVFAIIGANFAAGAIFTTSGGFSSLSPVTWISSTLVIADAAAGNGSVKGTWNLSVNNPDLGAATSTGSMVNS